MSIVGRRDITIYFNTPAATSADEMQGHLASLAVLRACDDLGLGQKQLTVVRVLVTLRS